MTDIQLLEKYARQRQKYRRWDFYAKDTDVQRLSRLETACWTLLFYFAFNLQFLVDDIFSARIFPKLATLGVLSFCGYLVFELHRTRRLRSVFESTAVQSAAELIEMMKRAPNQSSEATSKTAPSAAPEAPQG